LFNPIRIDKLRVSIHAPREGSDLKDEPYEIEVDGFNPRPPRGERHVAGKFLFIAQIVSIHAPREGSDHINEKRLSLGIGFNPRPPRGERLEQSLRAEQKQRFQSTPPERGATKKESGELDREWVSIHAPREGSDIDKKRTI